MGKNQFFLNNKTSLEMNKFVKKYIGQDRVDDYRYFARGQRKNRVPGYCLLFFAKNKLINLYNKSGYFNPCYPRDQPLNTSNAKLRTKFRSFKLGHQKS